MIQKIKFFLYIYNHFFNSMHVYELPQDGGISINLGEICFKIKNSKFFIFSKVEFLR